MHNGHRNLFDVLRVVVVANDRWVNATLTERYNHSHHARNGSDLPNLPVRPGGEYPKSVTRLETRSILPYYGHRVDAPKDHPLISEQPN